MSFKKSMSNLHTKLKIHKRIDQTVTIITININRSYNNNKIVVNKKLKIMYKAH